MVYFKKIFLMFIIFIMCIPIVYADNATDKNLVNIYLFYSDSCTHCASEKVVLNDILDNYDNVRLYKFEVSNDSLNMKKFLEVADLMDVSVKGVPFTVIADKPYKGFNRDESKRIFLGTIDYYSKHGYKDIVGEYLGNVELPSNEITDNSDFYDYIDNYGNYKLNILGLEIDSNNLSLSLISIVMGIIDGFNIYGILVILLLISFLKDNNKKWFYGISFLISYFITYLLVIMFDLSLLHVSNIIVLISGISFIFLGVLFLYRREYIKNKICILFDKFNDSKKLIYMLIFLIILSIIFVLLGFLCSFDKSLIFMDILFLNNLNIIEEFIYIFIYVLFCLLDEFIVFIIIMIFVGLSKYKKLFKYLCEIILLIIGIYLIIIVLI